MENNNNSSAVNTILLVLILVVVIGALVWFFTRTKAEQPAKELNVDVNLPVGDESQ